MRVDPIPAFQDNYIWLLTEACAAAGAHEAAVVDPGDAAPVRAVLARRKLELVAILITHHHGDHVGGLAQLVHDWPRARVLGPRREVIDGVTERVGDGDVVDVLGARFDVIDVPGHTSGHVAYYDAADGALFCGDTLFAGGCGRLFEGTPVQMFRSLQRLARLPDATRVYCAHEYTAANLRFAAAVEPENSALAQRIAGCRDLRTRGEPTVPSTIGLERATNPFLRCDEPAVRAAAAAREPGAAASAEAAFATIRAWKNAF